MFTQIEKEYISQTFGLEAVKSHFFKEGIPTLDPTNKTHILQALDFRNNKIGNIGVSGHKTMYTIYEKLGYGRDGKTTLIEIAKEQARIQQLEENKLNELKQEAIDNIDAKIKELETIREDLLKSNSDIQAFEQGEREKLEEELQHKLKTKEKQEIQKEIRKIQKASEDMNIPQLKNLAKRYNLVGYSKLRKNELINLINEELV